MFENNETIKDTEVNIQLKLVHYPVKQKTRPVPLHLQEDVGREPDKLMKSGHLEKMNDVDEDCSVSPVIITVENDKLVKVALDSRKLNDSSIKMTPHMPNMEKILNRSSVEITRDRTAQLSISKKRSGPRTRTTEIVRRNKPTMCIRNNRLEIQWIL